ncbi:MAG TPA: PAS domain S-box protein [Blastocatellia bacterium]|jgi:PAS domain S-box-containing protein|nr:PAS domain S-box protein [Blastocatellia bacterium]
MTQSAGRGSGDKQAQMDGIIASAMDAIITANSDQRIILFNAAAEQMFRCSADEAIGQKLEKFIPERFRDAHQQHVRDFGRTNVTRRRMGALGAISGLRSDGEEFPIEASISHFEVEGQKLFTVIIRDITERKQAEQRLREQAALLDHAHDGIMVRDLQNIIIFWNEGAERIYGWKASETVGENVRHLLYRGGSPEFEEAHRILLERGEWNGELHHYAKDGKKIIAESRWTLVRDESGRPKSIFAINTDVTEKKKLESQFLRAQRMESIGTLAGGIAHDLNNLLSPIVMAIRMLKLKLPAKEDQRMLLVLQSSAERAGELIRQVLSFARGVEGKRVLLQSKHLINDIIRTLRDTLPKSIEIEFSTTEDLWPVVGDPTQLHQVLMNLCVNARDAMPHGGKLTIEADNIYLDENYAGMNVEARPGRYVLIGVQDTGSGIPTGTIERIFEPFFTTKEVGKGTGLGLSTALAIVKSHAGFINVYSEGRGTQFKVYVPAAETGEKLVQPTRDDLVLPTGKGELILIVDDELGILEITKGTLETYGYRVLTANDGTEALAVYAQHKDEIRVVVTDVMMPYMDGPATVRALRKMNPRVKVVVSSGLDANDKAMESSGLSVQGFLSKPYTAERLLKILAEILSVE